MSAVFCLERQAGRPAGRRVLRLAGQRYGSKVTVPGTLPLRVQLEEAKQGKVHLDEQSLYTYGIQTQVAWSGHVSKTGEDPLALDAGAGE